MENKINIEEKIAYLQLLQEPISRMSSTSAIYKGFSSAILAGLASASFSDISLWAMIIGTKCSKLTKEEIDMRKKLFIIVSLLFMGIATQAQQIDFVDYQPLVREGRVWVNCFDWHNMFYDDYTMQTERKPYTITYTLEFKGDTIVDEVSYKKCYMRAGEKLDIEECDNVANLKLVSSKPVALVRETNKVVEARLCDDYPTEFLPAEYLRYRDEGTEYVAMNFGAYRLATFVSGYTLNHIEIEGQLCNMIMYGHDMAIEGIGRCADTGSLLVLQQDRITGFSRYFVSRLNHVLDANGNIIYKS